MPIYGGCKMGSMFQRLSHQDIVFGISSARLSATNSVSVVFASVLQFRRQLFLPQRFRYFECTLCLFRDNSALVTVDFAWNLY
jgi:hypothetical protein